MGKVIHVAIAGNPNSGKSTIFNALTGLRQHVGNYPGVTVDKKEGFFFHGDYEIRLVDLPGIYALTAYSPDERIARDYFEREKPDVVLNIVDASNLERNLYLTTQLMDMGCRMVLAFNMSDVAESRGMRINIGQLSALLRVPIVSTVGNKGLGLDALAEAIVRVAEGEPRDGPAKVLYGRDIDGYVDEIARLLAQEPAFAPPFNARALAVRLLENDPDATGAFVSKSANPVRVMDAVAKAAAHIRTDFGDEPEVVIADRRYGFISGACQEANMQASVEARHRMSDFVDGFLTHPVLGLPIFLLIMYLVFNLIFTLGNRLGEVVELAIAALGRGMTWLWPVKDSALLSLLTDGVIGGVGSVLAFLPNIALLFLAVAVLEDSGYMARAAFVTDRLLHKVGLHGKSFIPMLLGFGCTVPAVMATRIMDSPKNRLALILALPLVSCGARLPTYTLFISAFFPHRWQGPLLWGIYLFGFLLALLVVRLLRSSILKGEDAAFVMELPPYRMPTLRSMLTHTWERTALFLRKAGTIIAGFSALLWALSAFPKLPQPELGKSGAAGVAMRQLEYSYAGRIGKALEPALRPIGLDWKAGSALIGALAAKELFVAQLGIIHSLGRGREASELFQRHLRSDYSRLQAVCIMLFCLISMPCLATGVAVWRETGAFRWAAAQWLGLTALAYAICFLVFQVGTLLGA